MRRNAAAVLLVATLGGCTSFPSGPETGGHRAHWGASKGPRTVPGLKGPYGENIAMAAPYHTAPPASPNGVRQISDQGVPLGAVQMGNPAGGMPPGGMKSPKSPRGLVLSPSGVPMGPGAPANAFSGSGGPSGMVPPTGVLQPNMPMGGGVINASISGRPPLGALMPTQMAHVGQRTQIRFVRPSGMRISWFTQGPDGGPMFSTAPLEAPGRYNFPQAAIYRLKLSNIEGRPGLEVYPTMEVVPSNPKTEAFLAHSAVPIAFTDEDFKQIAEGNYLVKVIYLPDPQFQDPAGTGTDEILSTRLEPGADPIHEALRRGCILVVLRMGNVDQEAPNTPPLNAPGQHASAPVPVPPVMGQQNFGAPNMQSQAPFWATKNGMPPPGMPAPGALNVPSVPMPGNGGHIPLPPIPTITKPLPGSGEILLPPGPALPGASSRFQAPAPAKAPAPAVSDVAPPALPPNQAPAFPPVPGTIQPVPGGPQLSNVPPLPTSNALPTEN